MLTLIINPRLFESEWLTDKWALKAIQNKQMMALLYCGGAFIQCSLGLRRKTRLSKSIQSSSHWLPLFYDEIFLSWWAWSCPAWLRPPPIHSTQVLTEWFHDVNHMLWVHTQEIPTQYNVCGRFWSHVLAAVLLHQLKENLLEEQCSSCQWSSRGL